MARRSAPGALLGLLVVFGAPFTAFAGAPQERVRQTLDAVSAVLKDPDLQGSAKERERRERVANVMHDSFDFAAMGKDSLGAHWASLTPVQQEEFVGLFGQLFERSYNRLVLRFLGDSTTTYGAESIQGDRAVVPTTLVRKNDDKLPVEYRLLPTGGGWKISDVVVDGVSLAGNFRSQFDKTIRTSSYDGLVQKLKAKLAEES
jgi:phospholipid transport system substrate-binding protein